MTEKQKHYQQQIERFNRAKVIIGILLFCVMLFIHTYIKDLEWFIWAMPFGLIGLDPRDIIKKP